jgi:hypothetical protein
MVVTKGARDTGLIAAMDITFTLAGGGAASAAGGAPGAALAARVVPGDDPGPWG